ncbi:unnamed protein product [Coregonus sp. 'balchen']|nr:unnamed protein product [Coregonus sp. 'balchen']
MQAERNTLAGGRKLSKPPHATIKDKISKWEGKESSPSPPSTTTATTTPTQSIVERPDSLIKSDSKPTMEDSKRPTSREKQKNNGKENIGKDGDSMPTSPTVTTVPLVKRTESLKKIDARPTVEEHRSRPASKEKQQNHEKENVGIAGDLRPTSLVGPVKDITVKRTEYLQKKDVRPFEEQHEGHCSRLASREKQQNIGKEIIGRAGVSRPNVEPVKEQVMGMLKKDNVRRLVEQRAVFTLFKKLEQTMREENPGKSPLVLPGNYFCPPSRETEVEAKRRELESILGILDADQTFGGSRQGGQEGRDLENVHTEPGTPPINPVPKPQRTFQQSTFQHLSKSEGRTRSLLRHGKVQMNLPPLPSISPPPLSNQPSSNIYRSPRTDRQRDRDNPNRKSFEFEDILSYSSKENPYEDIEVSSQCSSQPSLPSSPGSECSKISRPGFFRQNSGGKCSIKLPDLRKTNHHRSDSGGGVASPPRLSPPSTPHSPDEARVGKKHLRRVYHIAETSSGRVTDENTDSESEIEDRAKAHRQRLSSVQSILSQPGEGQYGNKHSSLDRTRNLKELHQRQLFEYFLVVALHSTKAGIHYLPVVTQHFPLKLLDIRKVINNLNLDEDFYFNKSAALDVLLTPDQALIPGLERGSGDEKEASCNLERSFKFMRETEDQLRIIPQFCFPDAKDLKPVENYPSKHDPMSVFSGQGGHGLAHSNPTSSQHTKPTPAPNGLAHNKPNTG